MASSQNQSKAEIFREEMIRCRGIEFAELGMMVEIDGELGTIKGMNANANLNVLYTNQLNHGSHLHNCHPMWKVKYFDKAGVVIAHFDENKCVFRPERTAA